MAGKRRLIHGVGINDADYEVQIYTYVDGNRVNIWTCPYYEKWTGMLERCYSNKQSEENPTYKDCTVCDEWLYFSNFRKWMEQQQWEGRALDKDLLFGGNKVYSPSACMFVPQKINSFIVTCEKARGSYPLGVTLNKRLKKNPYISQCNSKNGSSRYLGGFPTPEQAHQAWLKRKLEVCESYLEEFQNESRTIKGLLRIRDKIEKHIHTNTELTSF